MDNITLVEIANGVKTGRKKKTTITELKDFGLDVTKVFKHHVKKGTEVPVDDTFFKEFDKGD